VEELFDGFDIEPPEATPQSQPPTTPDSSASTEVATPSGSNASSNGISSVIERSVALLAFKVKVESKVTKNRTFIESRKTKLELKKKQRELSNYCTLGS